MATALKHIFNPAYFESLLPILREAIPGFDCREFIFRIFNNSWPDLEFRQRVRHISLVLHHFLSKEDSVASQQIATITRSLKSQAEPTQNFGNIRLADYISTKIARSCPVVRSSKTIASGKKSGGIEFMVYQER